MPHPGTHSDLREPDPVRRRWLAVTSAAGGIGAVATAVPFVASMAPSERVRALGVRGCVPTFRPEPGAADIGASWPGGFYCPCHGSNCDLAGRVFKNVPAPSNLEVPPHHYLSDSRLPVGESTAG